MCRLRQIATNWKHYRQGMENLLNDITTASEEWAASGERRIGEVTLRAWPRELTRGHLVRHSETIGVQRR